MANSPVKDNHYVPKLYQKQFSTNGSIYAFRTLVSNERVPLWKKAHISSIGYREHLYTRLLAGRESDEIEHWLNVEFESPAEGPLRRAVTDAKLRPSDWERLIRFALSLDVRNPVWYREHINRLRPEVPRLFREAVERATTIGARRERRVSKSDEYFPRHLEMVPTSKVDEKNDLVEVEFKLSYMIGRGTWLGQMKHALEELAQKHGLYRNRWTILHFPKNVPLFTSDNPLVRLNYYSDAEGYDFKGGWANPGTEIFLPLSPHHLLFTKVGAPSQMARGEVVSEAKALKIRALIAEHANRLILAPSPMPEVADLRPRTVDITQFLQEKSYMARWHAENNASEIEIFERAKQRTNY